MFNRHLCAAFSAALLQTTYAVAADTKLFSSTKLEFRNPDGGTYYSAKTVKALLDSGEVIVPGNNVYGQNTCPYPAQTRSDLYCTPPLLHVFLGSIQIGQPVQQLPTDVRQEIELGFNHIGQMAAWHPNVYPPSGFSPSLIDIHTGSSAPLFKGSDNDFTNCSPQASQVQATTVLTDAGQLIGPKWAICENGGSDIQIWSTDSYRTMASPKGYLPTQIVGVNSGGQIALNATPAAGAPAFGPLSRNAGFIWKDGRYKRLPLPFVSLLTGFTQTYVKAINDDGVASGDVTKDDGTTHAVIWHNLTSKDIGTLPGFKSSTTLAMNSDGQVLACAYNNSEDLTTSGSVTKLFVWSETTGKKTMAEVTSASTDQSQLPEGCVGRPLYSSSNFAETLKVFTNRAGQWLLQFGINDQYLVSAARE